MAGIDIQHFDVNGKMALSAKTTTSERLHGILLMTESTLIHMYMAFWVKGSIKGMIEGKVSRRWAKKHHPRWYREIEKAEAKKESEKGIQ